MANEVQTTEYLLGPGYIILPEEPMLLYMILGSCVAVIIVNRKAEKAGCCHFIVPRTPKNDSPRAVHGTVAVLTLIRLLLEKGGTTRDLDAQVVGGSDLPGRSLGKENADIAVNLLKKKGIQISSRDTGGEKARKVIFNTENNSLAVVKVDKIRSGDWYPEEENT